MTPLTIGEKVMNTSTSVEKKSNRSQFKGKHVLRFARMKCLDCCCDQSKEVELCETKTCALWGLRFGTKPDAKSFVARFGAGWEWSDADKKWVQIVG